MRTALAVAAALALAACRVEVEGARCSAPGATTDCPDGQACGNDGRCSERAAACAARCAPGTSRCTGATATEAAETCTDADPVCGSWAVRQCAAEGLVCAQRGGDPHACECLPYAGTDFAADPGGSPSGAPPHPTGAASPRACRFQRLGDALGAAAALGAVATVTAYGDAGAPVVFGSATGETYPLAIPEGVTLLGAAAPAGETVIRADGASDAPIVSLGGVIEGFRIENISMTGTAIETSCGAGGGVPALRGVTIGAGAQMLATGVAVAGSCGALLHRVDVSGATGPALEIAVPSVALVTVEGSVLHGSGFGLRATGGSLDVRKDGPTQSEVRDNDKDGIVLTGGASTAIIAALTDVIVAGNGGTGIVVEPVSTASRLSMTSCDVRSNGTIAPRQYGGSGGERNAGGMLVTLPNLPAFQLRGNRFYGNGADQLAFQSTGTWPLTTLACDASQNQFGCVLDAGAVAVSVIPGGSVDARFTVWPEIAPPVNGNVDWASFCGEPPPPACPP